MNDDVRGWGLSCPQSGSHRDEVLDLLVSGHAEGVMDELTSRYATELAERAPGTTDLIQGWRADGAGFGSAWQPAVGDTHALLLRGGDDPARCAASFGLWLAKLGGTASWSARFERPTRLRFDRWSLPPATGLDVRADGRTVTMVVTDAGGSRTFTFTGGPGAWTTDDLGAPLTLIDVGPLELTLSTPRTLSDASAGRLLEADAYRFDATETVDEDAGWEATCRAAVDLVAEATPVYLPWVARVVNDLVALQGRPGVFNSGSERFSPGVVCVSNHQYRWPLAEMLVHEATHQYLHIISRLGNLDDGSDQGLYFSPFRNKDRPIFFIVVAYHAFANVLLFYRTARANGFVADAILGSPAFAHREETLDRQLAMIEPTLLGATSLTPLGQALWEPVYAELRG